MLPSLLVISDSTQTDNITDTLKQCIDMGAPFLGIRENAMGNTDLSHLLEQIIYYSENSGTLVSIWGNPNLAEEFSIGLHMSANEYNGKFKQCLDFDSPLGKSCHNATEITSAQTADYITVSSVYNSISKSGYTGIGVSAFGELLKYSRQPVFALGGITPDNIDSILEIGGYGIAVCGTAMHNPKSIKSFLEKI